jgi:hypothetical protein
MTKRRKKKQKRSLSDKGDKSSGNSSSDHSLQQVGLFVYKLHQFIAVENV